MAVDLPSLFKTLQSNIADLAKQSLSDYLTQATSDGNAVLSNLRDKIEQWSLQLSTGDLDSDDFKSLILGEKDLMKMDALTQQGLALVRIDQFKNDACNLIVDTVTAFI
ncbi:MAG TPA: hypothetical protein VNW51_07980 [Mucilaginibacter sp.]|jgi:hypothetical protein|nr:hypothetical protein [Mucilaginibacter sp.]